MANDKSPVRRVRRDIAAEPGQPGAREGRAEDGSRIQHVESAWYSDLMPEELPTSHRQPTDSTISGIISAQHQNFNNTPYGGVHSNSMDDVPRDTWPTNDLGIEVLESKFMGVDSDTPEVVASKPGQQMRNIPRPTKSDAGDFSRLGQKHPLNRGNRG